MDMEWSIENYSDLSNVPYYMLNEIFNLPELINNENINISLIIEKLKEKFPEYYI